MSRKSTGSVNEEDWDESSEPEYRSTVELPIVEEKRVSFKVLAASILFYIVYVFPIMDRYPTEHTCLAILVTICFLWITEAIPPFATAYLIPILAVWFQIGYDKENGKRISASDLATHFASKFMDPIIMVFLGSLVLSTALTKLKITTRVSRFIISLVPPYPPSILLVLMLINVLIGAFLSNVASTTLTLSLALPIIRSLDPHDPFIKAILFGIAWSGNCGGMPTAIASPQNVIAARVVADANKPISFMQWVYVGTPVSVILCLIFWKYLLMKFPKNPNERIPPPVDSNEEPWSFNHTQACVVTCVTIMLWSLGDYLSFIGHIGVASLIPIVWFFGSGILTVNDFNSLKWSTLALLGGGLALGEAMKISGLLDYIAMQAKWILGDTSAWKLLVIILGVEGMLASLLSSTTAASIMFPLLMAVGKTTGRAPMLVVLSALMISCSQLFHISSFPNALVSGVCIETNIEDPENGKPFLSGVDYIRFGWPTIIMGILVIGIIGFKIISMLGF